MFIRLIQSTWYVLFVGLFGSVFSADAQSQMGVYKQQLEGEITTLDRLEGDLIGKLQIDHLKALLTLREKVQSEGSLEKVQIVSRELSRFEREGGLPVRISSLAELAAIEYKARTEQSNIRRRKAVRHRRLLEQYNGALERLQKSLVRSGELTEAKEIKAERDRVTVLLRDHPIPATVPKVAQKTPAPTLPKMRIIGKPKVKPPADAVFWRGHHYLFVDTGGKISFEAAKAQCEVLGGHLVYLETRDELNFVANAPERGRTTAWIGAKDVDVEGKWKWLNGRPMSSTLGKVFGNRKGDDFAMLRYSGGPMGARNRSGYCTYCIKKSVVGYVCEWEY